MTKRQDAHAADVAERLARLLVPHVCPRCQGRPQWPKCRACEGYRVTPQAQQDAEFLRYHALKSFAK